MDAAVSRSGVTDDRDFNKRLDCARFPQLEATSGPGEVPRGIALA